MDERQQLQTIEIQIDDAVAALKAARDAFDAATNLASRTTWEAIILASSTTLQQLTTQKTMLLERLVASTGPQNSHKS